MFNVAYLAGGRLDFPFMPTKMQPYIYGDIMVFDKTTGLYKTQVKTFEFDVELTSVSMACSKYFDTDEWTLKVGDEIIVEHVFTKDLPEGVPFMAVIPVPAGTPISFQFHNTEQQPKNIWYNFHLLK